ncbi:hypothetical protein Krac_8890 [Ktedonobacter racemifer DSM 44963]|uniref:Uncharacterized protein n=1 Tax=Ktedonobacter racemifer DSM 44963 TaxID=485913 RepID=D6TPX1_KTERA|nr:hypothetical protein Krac_8890 [Ktedonobacter racemifer DSM 44963]
MSLYKLVNYAENWGLCQEIDENLGRRLRELIWRSRRKEKERPL